MSNLASVLRRLILATSVIALSIRQVSHGYACSSLAKHVPRGRVVLASILGFCCASHIRGGDFRAKKLYKNIIEGTFSTIEPIKGEPPASRKVRSVPYGFGNCTIPLLAGADSSFFLQKEDDYITFVSGSAGPIVNLNVTKVREKLEKLRALAK
jgi:hypothetical protein